MSVNGETHTLDIESDMPLLWALRDILGLTGTKYGCGIAVCGACIVHVDGSPVRACITPVESMQGKAITTIEKVNSPVAQAVRRVAGCGLSGRYIECRVLSQSGRSGCAQLPDKSAR